MVCRTLASGESVTREIPFLSSPTGRRRRPEGVFLSEDLLRPLLLPYTAKDELYPYQRRGVAWLLKHRRALLVDDMGLGKTAQALGAARRLFRFGAVSWALVVAPRTLLANWEAESARWAPELCVLTLQPAGPGRAKAWRRAVRREHLLITSYEQLRDPPSALLENPPDLIIADEAHRLRRRESQSCKGFRAIKAERLWALSGTPVERDAEDLAVLMSLLDERRFSVDDRLLRPSALRSRARPYMLRRRKDEVLRELPPVIESEEELELSQAQKAAYHNAVRTQGRRGANFSYLALFNELRMLCDLEPKSGSSIKLDRIADLLDDVAMSNEKAVVFSYLLSPLYELQRRLYQAGVGHELLTGDMSLPKRQEAVQRFKGDGNCAALLASSRVASEGLTLVEANHVFFVNRWWNPSSNAQARDRVVRIGQTKTVWVWTFVCRGTVETRLAQILDTKRKTFDELVDAINRSNVTPFGELFGEP